MNALPNNASSNQTCSRTSIAASPIYQLIAGSIYVLALGTASAQYATTPQALSPLAPIPALPKLETTLSSTANPKGILPLDNIVAVVNNEVITKNDLTERARLVLQQLQKQGAQLPPQDALYKQLLEREISTKVQLQDARESGVRVDDEMLDKALQGMADEYNLSMTDFRAATEQDGMKWRKFREEIRNDLILDRLRQREFENGTNVSEAEVDTQLATETREAANQVEYRVAHIIVQIPDQATAQQIDARGKRAQQALQELQKGIEFATVSAQYSDAPDSNLGWLESGRLPGLYLEALGKLKNGEISGLLRSARGFHIVKLLDKRGRSATPTVTQTHARHILIKNKDGLTDADAQQRLLRLRERLTTGADFAELAKVHSEDGSASQGGDLGWASPGDFVAEFDRAMSGLRDNDISQPIKSQYGWHLIQVLERRTEGMSEDRRRQAARYALRQRKADEAYQDWVRQMRDRAFVEYRNDTP